MRTTQLQAILSTTITPNASIDAMFTGMMGALEAHGVSTQLFTHDPLYPNPQLFKALLFTMRSREMPMFMVGMNASDELAAGEKNGKPVMLHDVWPFPLVSIMVDHPAIHFERLERAAENCVLTVVDEEHLTFLSDAQFPPKTYVFCPHGGPEAVSDPLSTKDRPIDVLFCGNISSSETLDAWLDCHADGDVKRRAALKEAFEAVYEGKVPLYRALTEAFARHGQNNAPHALAPSIKKMLIYIHQRQRLEALEAITERRVTILGNVAPDVAARLAHHDIRGEKSFAQACSMMAESKILLNCCHVFPHGAHERVFYGLSRGAVILNNPSAFLAEDLERGWGMVKQPDDLKEMNTLISDLCADPDRIDTLRAQGLAVYPERHTWRERMGRVLPAVVDHLKSGNA